MTATLPDIAEGAPLVLSGALTIREGEALQEALCRLLEHAAQPCIDLSGVEDLDCSALQMLYAAQRKAEQLGKRLVWQGVSPICQQFARLAGLGEALGFPAI